MSLTDHSWVLENISSYTAGGLDGGECDRLAGHVAGCPECARALEEARHLDRTLESLFADARPKPGLEDRMISRLRSTPDRPGVLPIKYIRFLVAAAAVLLLGMVGAAMSVVAEHGDFPLPGMAAAKKSRGPQPGRFLTAFGGETSRPEAEADHGKQPAEAQSVFALLQETKTETMNGLKKLGDRRELEDSLGIDQNMPKNYDMDRVEELSVPGALKSKEAVGILKNAPGGPPMAMPAPPGLGGMFGFAGGPGGGHGIAGGVPGPQFDSMPGGAAQPADSNNYWQYGKAEGRSGSTKTSTASSSVMKVQPDPRADNYYTYRNNDPKASVPAPKAPPAPSGEAGKKATADLGYFRPDDKARELGAAKAELKAPGRPGEESEKEGGKGSGAGAPDRQVAQKSADDPPPAHQPKIIRSGQIEFEVESYDIAAKRIGEIVAEERGFIATANSDKLPNGKMRGTIVVRCPPDRLDILISKLRALGDLKSQRIGSQDVTKLYTDLESRLRAARAMEFRLIEIIKGGKGEIKDLLAAEKELGVWRTKIEEYEGEIRYYNNLISLSTLTIVLVEREIRAASGIVETEKVDMAIEVEDVEKAQRNVHAAVAEAKGRISRSELKQQTSDQFQAVIHFEVTPDAAGPLRDRLKQFGEVTRLDIGRSQQTEGGRTVPPDTRIERNDVQFQLSLYNVANVAPRETVQLHLACGDPQDAYRKILDRVAKANGRIVTHNLDQQRNDQTRGTVNFDVKSPDGDAVLIDIKTLPDVEVMRLHVVENPDTRNVTRSKRGFQVQIFALGMVRPRETFMVNIAVSDPPGSFRSLQEVIGKLKGRVLNAKLDEQNKQQITADLDFEVRRTDLPVVDKALSGAGELLTRNVNRAAENEDVSDTKVRFQLKLINMINIRPRETAIMQMAAEDVPGGFRKLQDAILALKGHIITAHLNEQDRHNVTAVLDFEVRREDLPKIEEALRGVGDILSRNVQRAQDTENVLETKYRITLTLTHVAIIPPRETITLGIEVPDVDRTATLLAELIGEAKGRTIDSKVTHEADGSKNAKLVFDVPLDKMDLVVNRFKGTGVVRVQRASRNPQVPDSPSAIARIDVVLSNALPVMGSDETLGSSMRTALYYSFKALLTSLVWVLTGLFVIGPWTLAGYAIYLLVRWLKPRTAETTPATPAAPTA